MEQFLAQLLVFFGASVVTVPLAKKFKFGSVLGYLIAGMIIGPYGLSLIGEIDKVMHITEFGVVMMLFLVGLELKPSLLWQLRTPILGMGTTQVLLTCMVVALPAMLADTPWRQAVAVGLIASLSSTAIVLQTLREKGLLDTPRPGNKHLNGATRHPGCGHTVSPDRRCVLPALPPQEFAFATPPPDSSIESMTA